MAKVVRLKSEEQREWNHNQSILVDENGTVQRYVTSKETMAMFQLSRHVAKSKQGMTIKTPEEATAVEARIEPLPGGAIAIKFLIDSMTVVGGREAMRARMLAIHGECQLRGLNGKFITMIRDPRAKRPVAADAQRTTPSTESCICSAWAGRKPGKHHPVCQHNDKAPPKERGSFNDGLGDDGIPGNVQSPAPTGPLSVGTNIPGLGAHQLTESRAAQVMPITQPVPQVPSPENCHCKDWALPDGTKKPENEHHPICEFKDKWVAPETGDSAPEKMYVLDLDSGNTLREATSEEVTEADKNDGLITIAEKPYGIVDASGEAINSSQEEEEVPSSQEETPEN